MAKTPVVNKQDEQKAIVVSALFMLCVLLFLFFFKFEMADPPPKDFVLSTQMEIDEIVLKDLKIESGGGSGTPSDHKVDPKPKPQTEEQLTNKTSKSTSKANPDGKAKNTDSPNSNNEATSPVKSDNPFGGNGTGNDEKGGKGNKGLGPDKGVSQGKGGDEKARIRLNDPNADDIVSNINCIVRVKVTINANGDVIRAENISSISTTNDQRIINRVCELVKSQVKYNKKDNAALEQAYITVTLRAS